MFLFYTYSILFTRLGQKTKSAAQALSNYFSKGRTLLFYPIARSPYIAIVILSIIFLFLFY